MSSRIDRYCEKVMGCGENIDYGSESALEVVMSLFVDDGVKSRGHRNNLLNKEYKYCGYYSGKHSEYGCQTVQDFAMGEPVWKSMVEKKS